MSTPVNPIAMQSLSPQGKVEFLQLLHYLGDAARNPSGWTPEGSIPAIVNKQSAEVRQAFENVRAVMTEPRHAPFQEKWSESDYAERLGMDPHAATTCLAALDGCDVVTRLQDRMGNDSDLPTPEPTTRDVMSAAYDLHSQGTEP